MKINLADEQAEIVQRAMEITGRADEGAVLTVIARDYLSTQSMEQARAGAN